jgi:hypothetical protein
MDELLELMDDDDDGEALDEAEIRPMENSVAAANTINNSNNTNNDDNIKIMKRDRSKVIVTPPQSNTSKRTQAQAGRSGNSSSSNQLQHRNRNQNREREQESNTSTTSGKKTPVVESSVDDRIGIRMRNRLVSSNDLMELITVYMYFSPSVLSAMTLSRLNALLQDPSPIIDYATVAGKTENLVTIGIVFSNSGTRISSKGGAFCVLTIGNLNSGPCLSIFLFGSAYGKYCVSCKPGTVIALMQPKLLPANRGDGNSGGSGSGSGSNGRNSNNNSNNSTVTFSVYDIGQLKVVANAKDYGTCKASSFSRDKQNNGTWSSTGQTTCRHYVDKTISEYCDFHRKQNLGGSSNGKKQNLNKFQQIKSAHSQAAAPILVASKSKNNNNNNNNNKLNRFLKPTIGGVGNNNNNSAIRATATTGMMSMTKNTTNPTSSIGIRSGGDGNTGRNNIPMHMTKQPLNNNRSLIERKTNITTSNIGNKSSNVNAVEKLANRYSSKRARPNNSSSTTSTGDCWLKEAAATTAVRSKGTAGRRGLSLSQFTNKKSGGGGTMTTTSSTTDSNKKKRLINTVGCGFNGSVSIPKPSKMFQQQQQQTTNVANNNVSTEALNKYTLTKKTGELMQQQSMLAQRMKENESCRSSQEKKNNGSNLSNTTTKNKGLLNSKKSTKNIRSSNNKKSGDNSNNTFLDAMGAIDDQEKVRNAKSQFANEVDADEYANRRRKLLELEKLEASSGRKKTRLEQQNGKRLTKEWHCQTCRKKFSLKPKGCFTQNHQVRTNYDIKKSTTKDEQRTKLHGKSADDDGLTLGSGLDWSNGNDRVGQNRFN